MCIDTCTVIRYHFALKISKDILKMSSQISHRAIKILANEQSINYGPYYIEYRYLLMCFIWF